jgi:hypothetical protein
MSFPSYGEKRSKVAPSDEVTNCGELLADPGKFRRGIRSQTSPFMKCFTSIGAILEFYDTANTKML